MQVGKARHKLTLQKPALVNDGGGGKIDGWEDVATVWARIEPISAQTIIRADKSQMETTHIIDNMRYRADVSNGMRFAYKGRTFTIESVTNVKEANKELEIRAIEGGPL